MIQTKQVEHPRHVVGAGFEQMILHFCFALTEFSEDQLDFHSSTTAFSRAIFAYAHVLSKHCQAFAVSIPYRDAQDIQLSNVYPECLPNFEGHS